MVFMENLTDSRAEVLRKDPGKWNSAALQFLASACHLSKLGVKGVRNGDKDKQILSFHRNCASAGNTEKK